MPIQVVTFGDFDIKINDKSVLRKSSRASKNLELLKYFITYRNKKLVPETIVEALWKGNEIFDPKNVLRTQVFRLKRNMEKMGLMSDNAVQSEFYLSFENGFYIFETGANCIIDMDIFEEKIKFADSVKDTDIGQAIQKYSEALELYKGQYLAENPYSEWVYPIRIRYHRLYVHAVLNLMELLMAEKRYSEIVQIYEKASLLEPYEEGIHIYFLEALIELEQFKSALSHYNYITSKMYQEFYIEPTPALRNIYKRITADHSENRIADLLSLGRDLAEDDKMEGALYCELDYFKSIFNFERRQSLRTDSNKFLGLISIIANRANISKQDREQAVKSLEQLLFNCLRKGDVFCRWNPSQILLLLTNLSESNLSLIQNRIQSKFKKTIAADKFAIKIDFQHITASDPFT
ncbi:hypothetical protein JT739_08985 [Tepidanaerobacter sp. GT38]|uniref:BTAD domain-containing putative transcriptional regulator n=1 Tax=Tepidanaerobacter sp. GT38 TaxID=2722793 RepID=UPI001F47F7FE|nr:BTAD domain-containing putative transcriptional regulator [Tepidanaerobacter sp. GT38]MCG1012732.1 hypothetical protein [Tepidanaerobacter sp. GT38]